MNSSTTQSSAEDLRRTAVSDGTELAFRLLPGRGPARYALVHALAMDHSFWDQVAERLTDTGDVLVYDCRGHGQSGKPPGPYSAEGFAQDLADLFGAIGWSSAIVAGTSMGGCVAMAFAGAYPEKLDGLALVDTSCWYGPNGPAQWEERAQKAISGGLAPLVDFQKSRWFSDAFPTAQPEIVDQAVAVFLANDIAAYAEACRLMGRVDTRAALPKISAPTSVILGAEDYAAPLAMAEVIQQGIEGAKLHVIDAVRHFTPLEAPDIIAGKIRDVAAG